MKKLLIASTALVATAGMASADITITGHAAAGILICKSLDADADSGTRLTTLMLLQSGSLQQLLALTSDNVRRN